MEIPNNNHKPNGHIDNQSMLSLGPLRRFIQEREAETEPALRVPLEYCELCGTVLSSEHRHLLAVSNHRIVCSCDTCAILFSSRSQRSDGQRYRLIPRRYLKIVDFLMSDEQWDALMVPVNLVYLYYDTMVEHIRAFYPGAAGAMESLLSLEQWQELVAHNPILQTLEADVEALLINRIRGERSYYIVPIDACYELVGLIRVNWKGLSGGQEVWHAIATFFEGIQTKASYLNE